MRLDRGRPDCQQRDGDWGEVPYAQPLYLLRLRSPSS